MTIDISQRVIGVPAYRPLRRLAAHLGVSNHPVTTEGSGREGVAIRHAAVVDPPVRERFAQVEIDAPMLAVVQHEVPRPITRARQDPVDSALRERDEQRLDVGSRQPQVQVRMLTRLLPQQRVDGPAAAHAGIDSVIAEHAEKPKPPTRPS